MDQEHRGLGFAFSAGAEIAPECSSTDFLAARVKELSLRGCFLATSASSEIRHPVLLKICDSGEYFEAEASIRYVKSSSMGLAFREIEPHFREVLQKRVLTALDNQPNASQTSGSSDNNQKLCFAF